MACFGSTCKFTPSFLFHMLTYFSWLNGHYQELFPSMQVLPTFERAGPQNLEQSGQDLHPSHQACTRLSYPHFSINTIIEIFIPTLYQFTNPHSNTHLYYIYIKRQESFVSVLLKHSSCVILEVGKNRIDGTA